ncbi:S-layer homology domain-containing protein [Garciella nitratireducens]|uniref:Beta-N-acetylglucosaminidase n=1 Tax=Garciella nitratireducens DSM 15102 TaxID=1121911 RepID=A0A1T4LRV7_9FIRM|nr:S-layer homology domain-containing protein [Garciella nitratireducens]SJZ57479.1 Beta-N-acetylglucosaminidase [Garciella nitratireducens DSM 15102]
MKRKRIVGCLMIISILLSIVSTPVFALDATNTETSLLSESNIGGVSEDKNIQEINQENLNTNESTEIQLNNSNIIYDENISVREQQKKETLERIEEYNKVISEFKAKPKVKTFSITSTGRFQVAIANKDGSFTKKSTYTNFKDAKAAMNKNENVNAVVLDTERVIGNQVIAMKNGVVVTTADKLGKSILEFSYPNENAVSAYIQNGIDTYYFDSTEKTVDIGISNIKAKGIDINKVELVPLIQAKQSYYTKNSNGELVHYVATYKFNKNTNRYLGNYESFIICKAPSFMDTNVKYYSLDGINFYKDNKLTNKIGTFYPYYKYLSFRSKTNYTAEDLNRYISSWNKKDSVLNGKGQAFIQAQEEFGVNAAMLLAFAIHESGYGTNSISKTKNNIFSVNATDSNPYGNASVYKSVEDSIYYQAEYMISRKYLDANEDWRYFGPNVGDKNQGLNVKYASDPYWGEKITGHMYRLDKYLGNKDVNQYQLAISNKITHAKKEPNSNAANYYKYANLNYNVPIGIPIIITANNNAWYEIQSDMGIDKNKTAPASFKTKYHYDLSKAYVNKNDFTLINNVSIQNNTFTDIPIGHWAYEYIEDLANRGIIKGYEEDGTFRPNNPLTRAQTAKMIVIASGIDYESYEGKETGFKDVAKDNWAGKYIKAAKEAGIIKGYEDQFKPNDKVTRAQIAKMISIAFNLKKSGEPVHFKDIPNNHWAKEYIDILSSNDIISGYENEKYGPNDSTTRAQFSKILSEILKK